MRSLALFLLLLSISVTFGQKVPARKRVPIIKQGICGTVIVKSGNRMPGPGTAAASGRPVAREVLVFPLLNASQVDMGDNGFITSVRDAKPIKTLKSGTNGKFCISLPVGSYTLMVREPKGLYANLSDGQNNIFPVNVQKNHQSKVMVEITHEAVF